MSLQYSYDNNLIVWIDGSCLNNHDSYARRRAGYGVWFNHNHNWNDYGPVDDDVDPTNQNAEIEAAIRAINICASYGRRNIEIRSDSDFLRKSVVEHFPRWKNNGWRKADGNPLKNIVKFQELDDAIEDNEMNIVWTHVPGHQGEEGNEEADKLAKQGAYDY